jgi:hypothetical protein
MTAARALDMPEVTDAHRHAAFEAMHWAGWTFDAAMADDTRRRLIEARAHDLRTKACSARAVLPTPSVPVSRPACPSRPVQAPTLLRAPLTGAVDRKRAAAGDRDDD